MKRFRLTAASAIAFTAFAGSTLPAVAAPLDGSIDFTFGTNGRTVIGFDTAPANPMDLVLDTVVDGFGRVHLVGVVNTTHGQRIGIARLRSDGTLDENYGPDDVGLVVAPEQLGFSLTGVSAAFDAQGRLLVAGTLTTAGNDDFAVCRFTIDGALTAFPNGFQCVKVAFDLGGGNDDVLRGIAVQPDGRIVMAGSAHDTASRDIAALARLDTNGNLDPDFGGDGRVILENGFGYGTSRLQAVAVAANGKIIAVGEGGITLESSTEAFVARILANGGQDFAFGLGGFSPILRNSGRDGRLESVVLVPVANAGADPRIVAVGAIESSVGSGLYDGLIAALLPNGLEDPGFSSDGVQIDSNGSNLVFSDVQRESNGNLVIAGTIRANSNPSTPLDFYVTRYASNGNRDTIQFNAPTGFRLIDFLQPGGSDTANAIALVDDRVIIAGASLVSAGTPANLDFSVVALVRDRIFANGVD